MGASAKAFAADEAAALVTAATGAGGLATSSTTVRAWTAGSRAVHHIVDPRNRGDDVASVPSILTE